MKIIQANRSGTRTSLMDVFGCPMAAPVNSRKAFANPFVTKTNPCEAFANPFVAKVNHCEAFANPFVVTINPVQAFWLAKSRTWKANGTKATAVVGKGDLSVDGGKDAHPLLVSEF